MKSHKKYSYLLHCMCDHQRFKIVKINSANLLYLLFNRINGYLEEINGNKYLTLVPTNESEEKMKKYEELWIKIRDLIRSVAKHQMIMNKNM